MQIAGDSIGHRCICIYCDVAAMNHLTKQHEVLSFRPPVLEVMAAEQVMQMKNDLSCLLREDKSFQIEGIRKHCLEKVGDLMARAKPWNPFLKGKTGRDMSAELLIPEHITKKWERGELRALK